ncbi:MAG: OmpA family protein [Alphaproteobacteria bacterium]|nr:OmpA family protein [Alphaproteobacteria bacterium]
MIALLLALLLPSPADAAGLSADVELLRPTFSPGGPAGVDTPFIERAGVVRVGLLAAYARDPLLLYENGQERGAVIGERLGLHLGLSADFGRSLSARLTLPTALQWGSEIPELAADGPALGDLSAGLRFVPPSDGPLRAGLRADITAPSGTRGTWTGESTPRLHGGLLAGLSLGPLQLSLDAGVEARAALDTGRDLSFGTEAVGGLGLATTVWPERAALTAALVGRGGVVDGSLGGADLPLELLTGLQLGPGGPLQVDLGAGKGLTPGYGTPELRLFTGVTWVRRPPPTPPPRLRVIEVAELTDDTPDTPTVVEEGWDEGQLARVEDAERRIVIREPLQFRLGTAELLPESRPTLQQVATLMGGEWRIGHMVIEGHASDEGSFTYNYELSNLRARAVWEALVDAGVHPDRISYRGMGEVFPLVAAPEGEELSEAERARNRRVEFRIVWLRDPADETAEDAALRPAPLREPWSGEPATVVFPTRPAPPPPPPADPDADLMEAP